MPLDTVAGADKFGSVFLLRLPRGISPSVAAAHGVHAPYMDCIAMYFVGEMITSLQKCTLVQGGDEVSGSMTITAP